MTQGGSHLANPGVDQTFTTAPGLPFRSVYVDATGSPNDVYLALAQAVRIGAQFARVPAGTAKGFPIPESTSVSFLVDPGGLPANAGQDVYWVVTDTPGIATSTTQVVQLAGGATVEVASGNIDVGSMPAMKVDTSGGPVEVNATIEAGQTITVEPGATPLSVEGKTGGTPIPMAIDGSGNTVQIAEGNVVQVSGPNKGNVLMELNATGPVNVQNDILPMGTMVLIGHYQIDVANLANGATIDLGTNGTLIDGPGLLNGLWDGIVVFVHSAGAHQYAWDFMALHQWPGAPFGFRNIPYQFALGTTPAINYQGASGDGSTDVLLFSQPWAFASADLFALNNTGATIVSDTVDVWYFAVRAQVAVNNPEANPGQMQPAYGEFDTFHDAGGTLSGSGGSYTAVAAGAYYLKELSLRVNNNSGANGEYAIFAGGVEVDDFVLAPGDSSLLQYTFGDGISLASAGVIVQSVLGSGLVHGYATLRKSAGQVVPTSIQ